MSSETPGRLLLAARELQSLSQADIAKQTRLSIQTINDIENDVYDRFGASTFVRGYLRSYARAVGVSEEKILASWDVLGAAAKLISPAPLVVEAGFVAENRECQSASRSAPSRAVMVIGALVVLSVIVWWENQDATPTVPVNTVELAPKPAVVPKQPAPLPVDAPVVQPSNTAVSSNEAVKKVKHTTAKHHHAKPTHVTYTLKPVSPEELASDH